MKVLGRSVLLSALSLALSGCNDYETEKRLEKGALATSNALPLPSPSATLAEKQAYTAKVMAEVERLKARNEASAAEHEAWMDKTFPEGREARLKLKAESQAAIEKTQAEVEKAKAEVAREEAALYEWRYKTETDQMTGTQTRHAHLRSTSEFEFAYPYGGGSHGSLMVRQRKADGLNVLFSISKGQIVCPLSCTVRVRFDEKNPMTFTGTPPADHSPASLFLAPASKFVAELAKAKTTLVEVSYYQSGSRASEFKTEGFVWDSKPAR